MDAPSSWTMIILLLSSAALSFVGGFIWIYLFIKSLRTKIFDFRCDSALAGCSIYIWASGSTSKQLLITISVINSTHFLHDFCYYPLKHIWAHCIRHRKRAHKTLDMFKETLINARTQLIKIVSRFKTPKVSPSYDLLLHSVVAELTPQTKIRCERERISRTQVN